MIDGPVSICESRLHMVTNWVVQIIMFVYMISFSVAIILSIVVFFKFLRRQFFGNSFKISTQYVNYFHTVPCDNLFYTKDCIWAMYPNSWGIVGLVITQLALSIERYFSSVNAKEVKKSKGSAGCVLAVFSIIISSGIVYYLLYDVDPIEPAWHCAGIPYSVALKANILFSTLIGVDLLALVVFGVVWKINIREKRNKKSSYSISKSLHIEANLLVMRLFLPVVFTHFIMFSIHILGQIIIRTLKYSVSSTTYSILAICFYIIPLCTLVQLLMFLSILRKEDQRKKNNLTRRLERTKNTTQHGELYGTGLSVQWNLAIGMK